MARLPNYDPAEHALRPEHLAMTRREMLEKSGMGMGMLGLAMMLGNQLVGSSAMAATNGAAPVPQSNIKSPLAPKAPHFKAKAKHIIHIWAPGGPSHVDTWDPKPALAKYADQPLPGLNGLALPSPFEFKKMGQSGVEVSELWPNLGKHIDDMCVIRSLYTDVPAHEPASRFMHTGSLQIPKPSLGSWTVYGLGTENQSLPGFITLGGGRADYRQASFLPSLYQGVNVNYRPGMPLNQVLLNIYNQFGGSGDQRRQLDLARKLNAMHSEKLHREEQLESRIESFEMAFRMQTEATEAFDISKEPENIRAMYGTGDAGARLLVARRLVERGVRFVQVPIGGWDHHQNLEQSLERNCGMVDVAAAALISDLKRLNLLDETLIIWGGEFGRTVTRDRGGAATAGRDHNGKAMCCWMAGGGVKGGQAYGATTEFGDRAEVDKVHVHDLHATIMALLGFDHTKLTYRYNGRDFRLTDNFGKVVKGVIA
jgi:hypothetical protein